MCIIEEFNNKEKISLEEYLIKKMSTDFDIIIEENLNLDIDELEEEESLSIEQKNALEKINNNAIKKGLNGELSINNYIYYKKKIIL